VGNAPERFPSMVRFAMIYLFKQLIAELKASVARL
jgi:hypothetical protein